MSDSATFEFETVLAIPEVSETVSSLWNGWAYEADIYTYPESTASVFCTLDYIFGHSEERPMLISVLKYIHSISSNGNIYYYRCADFVCPMRDRSLCFPILEISLNDLFSADYSPSLAASIESKYLIASESIRAA